MTTSATNRSGTRRAVYVWDLPVRVCHWGLVASAGLAWYSAEQGLQWWDVHRWAGYTFLTLLGFRLLWGLFGSETARFADFLAAPGRVLAYLRGWWHDRTPSRGHNPLGGWAITAMLGTGLAVGVTGLFATDDILYDGPLAGWVAAQTRQEMASLHATLFDLLLVLVVLHVAAIAVYRLVRGERLLGAMITGYKPHPDAPQQPWIAPLWRAVAAVAVSTGTLALAVHLAP